MFKRAIPKCTPLQQARQDKARTAGCIACLMNGITDGTAMCGSSEIHHLTRTGRQIGQDETVCLGAWHHRGIPAFIGNFELPTSSRMKQIFGPSLAKGSKPFHARYGSNEELLAYQNKVIGHD